MFTKSFVCLMFINIGRSASAIYLEGFDAVEYRATISRPFCKSPKQNRDILPVRSKTLNNKRAVCVYVLPATRLKCKQHAVQNENNIQRCIRTIKIL